MTMTPDETAADLADEVVRFGPFALQPAQRVLMEGDTRIHLGSRAFDILVLLIRRAGTFVPKSDILDTVWPGAVVVEGNLPVHVGALRKALGDGRDDRRYIVNAPNRGYSFVAPLSRIRGGASRTLPSDPERATPGLTRPLHRVVGRDTTTALLTQQVRQHRLVTIVGAGGIGKTTVAVSVAGAVAAQPGQSPVHFIDLAPLSVAGRVPDALATALGLNASVDDAMPNILAFLQDKSLLLLLDNCEHVLDAVAELAEAVLRSAPGVRILATSREPLRAEGERVHRLQPLDLPTEGSSFTAAEAMQFGGIELFVDRATAALDTFAFEDVDAQSVADICRRLDGIPLAIEIAAASVSTLGLRGVEAALGNYFCRLSTGPRTAVPRHRTLEAVLSWSYALLSGRERTVLARISVFPGNFTLESAGVIASCDALTPAEASDTVRDLAAKSLVSVDASSGRANFRLLFAPTRRNLSDRLAEAGEVRAVRRRHAEHVLDLMRESEHAWRDAAAFDWRQRYGRHLDDVRSAVAWAMSADGDVDLGIAITVRSALLLFQLSRIDEGSRFASAAMDALARSPKVPAQLEFELQLVLGLILPHTHGHHVAAQRSLERSLAMAQERGDTRQLAHAYTTNWIGAYVRGDPRAMLEFSQRFEALTAGATDPATTLLYDWMKAPTLHLLGDQQGARTYAERSLAAPTTARAPFLSGALIDRRVAMGTILARVLWLQGLSEQAEAVAMRTVEDARRDGESVGLAYALAAAACPVALWTGRFDVARERISLLLRHTAEHSLASWRNYGLAFKSLLDWQEGERQGAAPVLPAAVDLNQRITQFAELLATLHPAWASETTFLRGDAGDAGWCQAELLRVRGERARSRDSKAAESLFLRSLERARQDGALSWELRTAASLGRLWMAQGRKHEAFELLQAVLDQVTEGHSTPEVLEAVVLSDALAGAIAMPPRPALIPEGHRRFEVANVGEALPLTRA
ncbi:winged helix-turn-helix domain-containing protein [Variovorax sp. J31P207]|uniref:ATP-binding protein n=1 Tax=Variovorax sp. J31P207 TaxID=3053510 RepID=UPI0025759F39|nr:winged helix-turn-helix domain-containing protein [Variovorax sp. J31P207]MDM0071752.1 winged helix-turn-helix domain-containing protein [Variovorax sp. J31P207]